ncbi:MAG: Asp-tRNA(Asn)/Glu-tRNA(Gln) amidotransferase GatCAB subunit A, partial [Acidobacteria bacterium]
MEISTLTIEAARSAVATGKITATVLVESFYDKIQNEDSQIGAFLTLSKERAIDAASRIDKLAADGKPLPPLAGAPVAIKDVMVTRGVRTTAGSKMLENYIPPYDCTAVARLEQAGAV